MREPSERRQSLDRPVDGTPLATSDAAIASAAHDVVPSGFRAQPSRTRGSCERMSGQTSRSCRYTDISIDTDMLDNGTHAHAMPTQNRPNEVEFDDP